MRHATISKATHEEEREVFLDLVNAHLDASYKTLEVLGRVTAVAGNVPDLLLRQLMAFTAEMAAENGLDAEEFLVQMTGMIEDAIAESDGEDDPEAPVITNLKAPPAVRHVGGFPAPVSLGNDGSTSGDGFTPGDD